jgi:toxin CcdB
VSAQFDLYRTRRGELIVVVQSDLLDELETRIFAPCHPAARVRRMSPRLAPAFWFADQEYRVMVPLLGVGRASELGTRLGSLAHLHDPIVRAMDMLITGV